MNKLRAMISLICLMLPCTVTAATWDASIYRDNANDVLIGGVVLSSGMRSIDKRDYDNLWKYNLHKLYALDLNTNEIRVIYSTEEGREYIEEYEVSALGDVALSIFDDQKNTVSITLLNRNNVLKRKLTGFSLSLGFFTWSLDGKQLAYIKSHETPESEDAFPDGVFTYDVESKQEQLISPYGEKVVWSRHDNNIYIDTTCCGEDSPQIILYDTKAKKEKPSPYPTTSYSRDGKYYHDEERNWEDITQIVDGVERTHRSNVRRDLIRNLSDNKVIYTFDKGKVPGKIVFFPDNTHLIKLYTYDGLFEIHDFINKKEVRKVLDQSLLGWNKDMTRAVVYVGKDTVQIQNMLTGQVLKSFKLPQ